MTPADAGAGAVTYQALTRERCEALLDRFLEIDRVQGWEAWTAAHFLADRPGKWELSRVALHGGEPVGYAVSSRDGGAVHLHRLVIAPGVQGQGVGAGLLQMLKESAAAAGAERVTLKVARTNAGAIRFYLRHGFADVPEPPGEYARMAYKLGRPAAR